MIQKRKLFFPTLSRFLLKKIAANATNTAYITGSLDAEPQQGEPDVMWQSEVYIADIHQIWTNGTLFGGGDSSDAAAEIRLERAERIAADSRLQDSIPDRTSELENDSGFLTAHQPIKTLNGQSLVGSGDISILSTERHFEVDDDGNLIEIRSGSDDDTSFEIDADGNFIRIIN